jgi:hypothetical protein
MKKILYAILILSTPISLNSTIIAKNLNTKINSNFFNINSSNFKGLNPKVLKLALTAYSNAKKKGIVNKKVITIVDFSLPSNQKRLWILDLNKQKVLFHVLVAHGIHSGRNYAAKFSNNHGSKQSSIGVFLTKSTYIGHNGCSLVLAGLERGYNDQAEARHVVMHGAHYVKEKIVNTHKRIGRSWGCPAVDMKLAKPIINTIKDGSIFIIYYPDKKWLRESKYLNNNLYKWSQKLDTKLKKNRYNSPSKKNREGNRSQFPKFPKKQARKMLQMQF